MASKAPKILSRPYYSPAYQVAEPYSKSQRAILAAALAQVPAHGFTEKALDLGTKDAGYLEITKNLLPKGVYELIGYHLYYQKERLKEVDVQNMGTTSKILKLCQQRLRGNEPIINHWQQALAVMSSPSNAPSALNQLAALVDEIWFLAGDRSVDMNWYSKRASLASVYASTELYMTQDDSPQFRGTFEFLERRLADAALLGSTTRGISSYLGFTAQATMNVLRSKGVRI